MRVVVSGVYFSAAHFVMTAGEREAIHGHNYEIEAEVEGKMGREGYVVDFRELRRLLREAAAPLDHKFLLPEKSRSVKARRKSGEVEVAACGKRFVFPEGDVAFLPLSAITAEQLARFFYGRIKGKVGGALSIRVFESPHASAVYP
ncbi:MAG: 6-carboxytetrahydropterin synthase [Candidatus Micrarchaeia archaeon]